MMSRRFLAVACVAAFLGSCTPGTKLGGPLPVGSPTPTSTTPPPPPGSTTAPLTFTFAMPTVASMKARRPLLASANTQSLAIFIYAAGSQPGSTPTATANVGASATGCATAGAQITCSITVTAPLGNQELEIVAMSGPNGTGTALGSVTQAVTVAAGAAPISLTLNGTPALIKLSLETPVLALGTSGTSILDVDAYDATGALIVAPGSFTAPLTIASSSTSVSLSTATASAPGTKITVTYGGSSSIPYAVQFTATGGGVPTSLVVGATLLFEPSQSMAIVKGGGGTASVSTLAITALSLPAQAFTFLTSPTTQTFATGGFAALPDGGYAAAVTNYTTTCSLVIYPVGSTQGTTAMTFTYSGGTSAICPIASEPATGDLLVADNGGGSELTEYSVSGTTVTATGRTITGVAPIGIAVNATGAIAIINSGHVVTYAAGASGAAAPSGSANLTVAPSGVAIGSDGAVDVIAPKSGGGYTINEYDATLASHVSVNEAAASGTTITPYGIGIDASDEALALYSAESASMTGSAVDVWAPGSQSAPARTLALGAVVRGFSLFGPIIAPSPVPPSSNTAVTGDMIGYAANRAWTYQVAADYSTPYYVGLYADPNLVNGNIRLVGFESSSSSPSTLFTSSNEIGSLDVTPLNGSYLAAAFASVSSGTNGTSGSVPGSPLLVPGSMTLGQAWNPLQNAGIAGAVGVTASAQVVATGNVPGIAACPSGSRGATVSYAVQIGSLVQAPAVVSYVPGCGITAVQASSGQTSVVLQSVGSMPSLGQLDAPRGQPPIVAALHALWQRTLGVHPPSHL